MSEGYTPITHELREYIERHPTMMHAVGLTDLCDYIDAMHKKLHDDHATLERECAEMRDFCERVEKAAQAREDVTLFGTDYKALPLGADGMSINVGDKGTVNNGNAIHEVKQLVFEGNCWWIGCKMEMASGAAKRMPSSFRHYKSTMTDLLRELVDSVKDQNEDFTELIIKEYAKRLQLAEVDE